MDDGAEGGVGVGRARDGHHEVLDLGRLSLHVLELDRLTEMLPQLFVRHVSAHLVQASHGAVLLRLQPLFLLQLSHLGVEERVSEVESAGSRPDSVERAVLRQPFEVELGRRVLDGRRRGGGVGVVSLLQGRVRSLEQPAVRDCFLWRGSAPREQRRLLRLLLRQLVWSAGAVPLAIGGQVSATAADVG